MRELFGNRRDLSPRPATCTSNVPTNESKNQVFSDRLAAPGVVDRTRQTDIRQMKASTPGNAESSTGYQLAGEARPRATRQTHS